MFLFQNFAYGNVKPNATAIVEASKSSVISDVGQKLIAKEITVDKAESILKVAQIPVNITKENGNKTIETENGKNLFKITVQKNGETYGLVINNNEYQAVAPNGDRQSGDLSKPEQVGKLETFLKEHNMDDELKLFNNWLQQQLKNQSGLSTDELSANYGGTAKLQGDLINELKDMATTERATRDGEIVAQATGENSNLEADSEKIKKKVRDLDNQLT